VHLVCSTLTRELNNALGDFTMREDSMRLLRLKQLEMAQREKVALLETMIIGFESMAADLAQQIALEEERTKIRDVRHVAYSSFATSAALRRRNLLNSAAEAKSELDVAKRDLADVTTHLRDMALSESQTLSVPMNASAEGPQGAGRDLGRRHPH
jgi:flagellar protein FliJ